jgi:hypothetical protein
VSAHPPCTKEPALSPAPRHRAPEPSEQGATAVPGRLPLLARLNPKLFLVTAFTCAALLIAAPLAILFSGSGGLSGLVGGSGSGADGGGSSGSGSGGSGSGGSGSGVGLPGGGGAGLTTAAMSTDANGNPIPAAQVNAITGGQAGVGGSVPGGGAGSGSGGGTVPGGGGAAGGQPVGAAGGQPAPAGGGGSGGGQPGGSKPTGGSGSGSGATTTAAPPAKTTAPCICAAVSSAVATLTKALPPVTVPSLPKAPAPVGGLLP